MDVSPLNLYEILVPTIRKGKPIRLRFHRVWDAKVRNISGGITVMTPTKGQWINKQGELFIEKMIPVRISCTEAQMSEIAQLTLNYYEQEAVFYYQMSEKVFTLYKSDVEPP